MADKRQTIEEEIADLFKDVLEYRNSEKFKELLQFCVKLNTLGSYNAMLVKMQCPEARYVLPRKRWAEYNRQLKPNARPLMILAPFGPVSFVFDISVTEPMEGKPLCDEEFFEELSDPFRARGKVKPLDLEMLQNNLKFYGIKYNPIFYGSNNFTASLEPYSSEEMVELPKWRTKIPLVFPYSYLLTINGQLSKETTLVSFCHEMAHYFCQHIEAPKMNGVPLWEQRRLSRRQLEFEAETVAWLITRRHGIQDSKSVEYLAEYVDDSGSIPVVSVGHIMSAVDKIDQMFQSVELKKSWLYKNSDDFRRAVDEAYKNKESWINGLW